MNEKQLVEELLLRVLVECIEVVYAAQGHDAHNAIMGHGLALEDAFEPFDISPWLEGDGEGDDASSRTIGTIGLAGVTHKPVEWLWYGKLPRGKIAVIDGDPGLGKSTATIDLAARITTGRAMPDGTPGLEGGVLLLSAEDDLADTIGPRFEAAGGDPNRCALWESVANQDGSLRPPEFPADTNALEDRIRKWDARLVVIDPLMAYLGDDVKSNSDHNVRRALAPLKSVAESTGACILLIRHLNKDRKNGTAVYRGGGSIGIIGAARAGLIVARDPEDETRRVLAVSKANLAPEDAKSSLAFHIVTAENGVGAIEWLGKSDLMADDIVGPPERDHGAGFEAKEFLREQLEGDPMLSEELEKMVRGADISMRTYRRARKSLGVRAQKRFDGKWESFLPLKGAT